MRHCLAVSIGMLAGSLCAFGSIDSGLLSLVPASAKIVAGFDVTNSRNSTFGQYLLAKSQAEDPHLQKLMQETGFDPRRDLQSLLFESGEPLASRRQSSFAILARGTFDEQRIQAHALAEGATARSYQGVQMMVNESKGDQTALAFLDTGVAVLADVATLQQIIQNRATPSVLDPALQSKINPMGGNNDIWFATLASGDFLAKRFHADSQGDTGDHGHAHAQSMPDQAKILQSMVQSSGGIRLGSSMQLTFDAVADSSQDATSLADVIHFLASMVQMQRQSDPRADLMASSLDSMTVQTAGNEVHFAMSIPEKSLEQLAELAPKAKPAPKPNIQ